MKIVACWWALALGSLVAAGEAFAVEGAEGNPFSMPNLFAEEMPTMLCPGLRCALEKRGVEIFASYTAEVWGNVAGGERRGAVYTGLLEFGATLDLERLSGWEGASLHNSWLWLSGRGPSDRLAGGNFFAVSAIEGFATFRLGEMWFQQEAFSGAVSVRLGQLAADQEFAVSDSAGLFLNGTFGWPAFLSANIPDGGPAYPLASPGVRLEIQPAGWLALRGAVFQGHPGSDGESNRHGFTYDFSPSSGALFLSEAQWRWSSLPQGELPGSFKAGAWFHTARFSDPGQAALHRHGNAGFYFMLDQTLFQPAISPSPQSPAKSISKACLAQPQSRLAGFARLAFQPEDRNPLNFYMDAGLTWQGVLPGRPDDTLGFAFAWAQLSRGARSARAAEGGPGAHGEIVLEWTY